MRTRSSWQPSVNAAARRPVFVDVFAGAGGLSLGLMKAGFRGLFAVERDDNAFQTLQTNLVNGGQRGLQYDWPEWLPKEPIDIAKLLRSYRSNLLDLRGSVDLLAGGPPCQGFSPAGRRRRDDPRNLLFHQYVEMARLLEPAFLVFENVPGIGIEFDKGKRRRANPRRIGRPPKPFLNKVVEQLERLGYRIFVLRERASDFGVPQARLRYLVVGAREELAGETDETEFGERLAAERERLLAASGLPLQRPVTVREAISDLEANGKPRVECPDSPRFEQIVYQGPLTRYQRLMHEGMGTTDAPNSIRLVKHRRPTVERFARVLAECRKGVRIRASERERFAMSSITPLDPDRPSNTVTSLPDDFLHYSEARILTVRELARLQSFPDWFEFRGKYTTGGQARRIEVPRYTQVANAVPPLLAEAVGSAIAALQADLLAERSLEPSAEALAV